MGKQSLAQVGIQNISTRYFNLYEDGFGINGDLLGSIQDTTEALKSRLSPEDYALVTTLTARIGDYQEARQQAFFRIGFIEGFTSGSALIHPFSEEE